MNIPRLLSLTLLSTSLLLASPPARAGNATWNLNPATGDWNTAENWTPNTVPNGTDDIATFGVSHVTEITQSTTTILGGMQFEPGASGYNINVLPGNNFRFNDAGVTNDSGVTQSINCSSGNVHFSNTSSAGENVIYTNTSTEDSFGSYVTFHDKATAGSASFISTGLPPFASAGVLFVNNSSAGSSHITANGVPGNGSLGFVEFDDESTAAESTITLELAAQGLFYSPAGAANSTVTCSFSLLYFLGDSTAGAATITCSDASIITFFGNATAGAATITSSGSTGNFLDFATGGAATFVWSGSTISFDDHASAGAATFTADASTLHFEAQSDGGAARMVLINASTLLADHERKGPIFHLGSLEGDATASATINRAFVVGGNNLDAIFSGNLTSTNEGDWLTKVGTGTWTLAGSGSYPGSTTVTAGTLVVTGASTPTGSGPVKVNAGTLGGSGTIAGPVTIGMGNSTGAFLAPAYGGKQQLTLTIQSGLTFNADATYTYTFKAKGNKSKIDKVVANGVTINSGAQVNLSGTTQGQLTQGTALTLIKNTAATPIAGTFSNLPDGAIINVNGNNLQANYEGGDGNDLTLTVVP
jgi:fibronectin-binding autotransporter adhesin